MPLIDDPICKILYSIVRHVVDNTAAIRVEQRYDGMTNILDLKVSPPDIGKIIGRQGRTAKSIRTILSAAGMRENRKYLLNIHDSVNSLASLEPAQIKELTGIPETPSLSQ